MAYTKQKRLDDSKMTKQLVAKLREADKAKIKAGDKIMLLISVGTDNFNKEAMWAMVMLLNEIYDDIEGPLMFVLNVADTLQRFNIAALNNSTPDQQKNESFKLGDKWLKEVEPALAALKGTKHIIRWDEWLLDDNYTSAVNEVIALQNQNPEEFNAKMDESVNEYVERQRRILGEKEFNPSEKKYRKYCKEYLWEEIATMILWKKTACRFVLYPGKQTAIMDYILKKLIHPKHPDLLQWFSIRLKRVHDNLAITQAKNTLFLEKVIASTVGHIYWKDKNGIYLGCNDNQAKTLGYKTGRDIIGKTDFELPWKGQAPFLRKIDVEVMDSKKPFSIEEPVIIDGEIRIFLSKKVPLEDENGKIMGVLGISIDITNHKRSQQEVSGLKFELNQAQLKNELQNVKLKEQEKFKSIASQVVHDIRSPLASLSMIVKSCKKQLDEPTRTALQEISTRINDIANGLLNQYKIEDYSAFDETEELQASIVSLLLLQLLVDKKYEYSNSPIQFTHEFSPKCKFAFISVPPLAFKRMISNIVNNSVEALEGKEGTVSIKLEKSEQRLKIIIQDNGKGISPSTIDKIKNGIAVTKNKKNGSGIGYAQIRQTLQHSHGELEIESKIGSGTKVTLTFPIIPSPDWIIKKIQLHKDDTVVILDDDPSIHLAWASFFKPYKNIKLKHFKLSSDAEAFINSFSEKDKLLFLSDFELINQKYNGLQVIERTLMQPHAILITSHHSKQNIRDLAIKAGVKLLPKQLVSHVPVEVT